ncbi:MAG: DUF5411 family protein [Bacilli bacterium]|nr:DUF5411 family protein [Bacilli bacterium]
MKYGFLGFVILMLGMIGLIIIVMFESITIDNDTEYYTLKEAMKASMLESIDDRYWADANNPIIECSNGKKISGVKIVEQKFVENFTRRFKASIGGDADDYKIDFYDVIESPPKATIKITGVTDDYKLVSKDEDINIVNNLSGILETCK